MADPSELFPSSLCNCSEKPATHVHCPCNNCKGKAVNRRTQLRHIALQNRMEIPLVQENVEITEERQQQQTETLELETQGDINLFYSRLFQKNRRVDQII